MKEEHGVRLSPAAGWVNPNIMKKKATSKKKKNVTNLYAKIQLTALPDKVLE